MKKQYLICFFTFFLLLSNCSINKSNPKESAERILKEMEIWQQFRIEGIVTISENNLSLVKNINISRDLQQLKVILYDTGIFGFSPQPFAKIVISDSIQVVIPSLEDSQGVNEIKKFVAGLDILYSGFLTDEELSKNISKISKTRKFENKSKYLEFNKKFQLTSVKLKEYPIRLEIDREFSDLPKEIDIFYENKLTVAIDIDRFNCEND